MSGGGIARMWSKKYELPVTREISTRDVIYYRMAVLNAAGCGLLSLIAVISYLYYMLKVNV